MQAVRLPNCARLELHPRLTSDRRIHLAEALEARGHEAIGFDQPEAREGAGGEEQARFESAVLAHPVREQREGACRIGVGMAADLVGDVVLTQLRPAVSPRFGRRRTIPPSAPAGVIRITPLQCPGATNCNGRAPMM